MENSSYNIENVYNVFNKIDGYFYENNQNGTTSLLIDSLIHDYCHYGDTSGKDKCQNNYFKMASSGVIHLLKDLMDKNVSDYDKLAEYAILWLSYKLNQNKKYSNTKLNEFYTKYIETNNYYNNKINGDGSLTYKDIINKNNDLMNIKEISKFSYPFGILLSLYYLINNKKMDCTKYSEKANEFVQNFETLNNDSNNIEKSSFSQILSTLSNDYKNIKKIYHGKKSCDLPSIPELILQKNPVKNSGETLGKTPEITSSSSILNTVIPGLSTFAIPVFLVVAYKYSLFGIDKLFQRQYIRIKLKKLKKKMKINI
ncbi:hypothetical protein YYE_04975 [Plasmodium vinckei vinckei]|uniref:CIR protein PIR protein n=1 Tax=Plasmodium vinckei vinckei TaxID=54757 RepID=A0A081I918_PLAVN|nr:hypothetical protein YYE_04975 [Plasmodium vinckei vinckei]